MRESPSSPSDGYADSGYIIGWKLIIPSYRHIFGCISLVECDEIISPARRRVVAERDEVVPFNVWMLSYPSFLIHSVALIYQLCSQLIPDFSSNLPKSFEISGVQ